MLADYLSSNGYLIHQGAYDNEKKVRREANTRPNT